MAVLVLYGSNIVDSTVTTACDMAAASGGTQTSTDSHWTGSLGQWAEVWSKGTAAQTALASIPATPTGNGWVYNPGAGTFALGNWSASIGLAEGTANSGEAFTMRFFKYSSGVYTSIGTIA